MQKYAFYYSLRSTYYRLISNIAGSSNGRTSPSGGEYLGSNPGPAAVVDIAQYSC